MKTRFVICLLSIAFAATSCDKGPEPRPAPRGPNDVTGFYDVDYRIYLDNSPLPVFVSSGQHPGSVEVRRHVNDGIQLYFRPNDQVIEFEYTVDNTLSFWTQVESKATAGNYTFNCPERFETEDGGWRPGGSVQFDFIFNLSRPAIKSHAEVFMTGTIVAKKANDTRNVSEQPDRYHDLNMTVEFVPFTPTPLFSKLYLEITSR